jgi:hypothetical protein
MHNFIVTPSISADIVSNAARFFYNLQNNSVGIQEQSKLHSLVYPNPTSEQLFVTSSASGDLHVSIKTLQGKTLLLQTLEAGTAIDLTAFAAGIYLVEITQNNTVEVHKLIVKK